MTGEEDDLVDLEWTEVARSKRSYVRRVAASDRDDPFARACRKWAAENPELPKAKDLPVGTVIESEEHPYLTFVKTEENKWRGSGGDFHTADDNQIDRRLRGACPINYDIAYRPEQPEQPDPYDVKLAAELAESLRDGPRWLSRKVCLELAALLEKAYGKGAPQ